MTSSAPKEDRGAPHLDAARAAETERIRRIRADAQRPMSVNLADTIALSHQLLEIAGSARRP
jgi:hypothetical protein